MSTCDRRVRNCGNPEIMVNSKALILLKAGASGICGLKEPQGGPNPCCGCTGSSMSL